MYPSSVRKLLLAVFGTMCYNKLKCAENRDAGPGAGKIKDEWK